jgi:hypothetical protein
LRFGRFGLLARLVGGAPFGLQHGLGRLSFRLGLLGRQLLLPPLRLAGELGHAPLMLGIGPEAGTPATDQQQCDRRRQPDQEAAPPFPGNRPRGRQHTQALGFGDREGPHRLWNILEIHVAERLERQRQLVAYLVVDAAGDADAAGLRRRLQPRGEVDAVAEQILALQHDVAEIDPDPKLDLTLIR